MNKSNISADDGISSSILGHPQEVMEKICSYLSLQDLSYLSMSSKLFSGIIGEFLRHTCSTKVQNTQVILTHSEEKLANKLGLHQMVGMHDLLKMYKLLVSREVARVRVIQENGPKEGRIREMGEMVDSRMVRLQQDEVKEITYLDFKWKHIGPGKFTFSLMLKINDLNCWVSGKRLSWAIYFENQNGRNVLRSGRGKLLFNEKESRMELDEVIGEQRRLVRIRNG